MQDSGNHSRRIATTSGLLNAMLRDDKSWDEKYAQKPA